MRHLAMAVGVAIVVASACAFQNPGSSDYPCGTQGLECGRGLCCWQGDECGGTPTCPAGYCCWDGENTTQGIRLRRPQWTTHR